MHESGTRVLTDMLPPLKVMEDLVHQSLHASPLGDAGRGHSTAITARNAKGQTPGGWDPGRVP